MRRSLRVALALHQDTADGVLLINGQPQGMVRIFATSQARIRCTSDNAFSQGLYFMVSVIACLCHRESTVPPGLMLAHVRAT